jgi:hypothetical protein
VHVGRCAVIVEGYRFGRLTDMTRTRRFLLSDSNNSNSLPLGRRTDARFTAPGLITHAGFRKNCRTRLP